MTVINAMKFADGSGGMIADSQSSGGVRKYDISDKISHIEHEGRVALVGGTGYSSLLYTASQRLQRDFDEGLFSLSTENAAERLSNIMIRLKRDLIDKELESRFGITAQEYQSGVSNGIPLGAHVLNPAREVYEGTGAISQFWNNAFIVLGSGASDGSETEIYTVSMGMPQILSSQRYESAGSGQDQSDKVLNDFVKRTPRDQRGNISPVEGLSALISATNASSDFNQGVGGVPRIAYLENNKAHYFGENASILATEIIRARDLDLIDRNASTQSIEELMKQTDNDNAIKSIEKAAFGEKKDEILRAIRGYRS